MAAVNTGVNLDTTGVVNPRCFITAVETSAPQIDGSFSPLDESAAPVYNKIHQLLLTSERLEKTCEQFELTTKRIRETAEMPTPAATSSASAHVAHDVALHPGVDVSDTSFDLSPSFSAHRCEAIRIGDRDFAGQIRVLYANENPNDWRSGRWIPRRFFMPDGKRARLLS